MKKIIILFIMCFALNASAAEKVSEYIKIHDKLTKQYYVDKSITKEDFDKLHKVIWAARISEQIVSGEIKDYEVPVSKLSVEKIKLSAQVKAVLDSLTISEKERLNTECYEELLSISF